MHATKPVIILMAGGQGKRMNSSLPKVLHQVAGKPMIVGLIEQALMLDPQNILIIVGIFGTEIRTEIERWIQSTLLIYVDQPNPMGTGHAVLCTLPILSTIISVNQQIIILNGDTPMLQAQTIQSIIDSHRTSLTITALELTDPTGNGRIIRDHQGIFHSIVEQKDATPEQAAIKLTNVGIYVVNAKTLFTFLPRITNQNAQKEYYLTDLVSICRSEGLEVGLHILPSSASEEIYNVNTQEQLRMLEEKITSRSK
jgi:UDP-N-acetylglucosamine diphosphorylase/glucosamine-1-phosphate N-acetyltransferase